MFFIILTSTEKMYSLSLSSFLEIFISCFFHTQILEYLIRKLQNRSLCFSTFLSPEVSQIVGPQSWVSLASFKNLWCDFSIIQKNLMWLHLYWTWLKINISINRPDSVQRSSCNTSSHGKNDEKMKLIKAKHCDEHSRF